MDFKLCTYKSGKKGAIPRLALSLRRRHNTYTLLFNDGSYMSTWDAHVHPLTFLEALPIIDRIALLDESMSTFPILVRLSTGAALGRPGVRVTVGADTLHPTRGLLIGTGWSGSYDMIDREFNDVDSAIKWTTEALAAAAIKTSAKLKVYFAVQDKIGRFDGEDYKSQLCRDGYLVATE